MLANPFTKALRDSRRAIIGWVLIIGGIGAIYSLFYPEVNKPAMAEAIKNYPKALREALNLDALTTPAGYLGSYVFGLLTPILLAIFMVIFGTRELAGDEEGGTLDLVQAYPVSRVRLLLSRLAALLVAAGLAGLLVFLVELAIAPVAQLGQVGAGFLAAASLHLAVLGAFFGTLTLAVGAATGRRSVAIATGTAVAVLGYFANNLAPQVHSIAWLQKASPFYWYAGSQPLQHGVNLAYLSVLVLAAAALGAAGTWRYTKRDLSV